MHLLGFMHTRWVEISSGDLLGPTRPVYPLNQAHCFVHRWSIEINSGDVAGPLQPVCMFYHVTCPSTSFMKNMHAAFSPPVAQVC